MPMRRLLLLLLLAPAALAQTSQTPKPAPTLRSSLLDQLCTTHNKAEWFTPVNAGVAGLTPDQAKWNPTNAAGKLDPVANHSVGMLAYHLWFWNARVLAGLKGQKVAPAPSNNDETFNDLDTTLTELETLVTLAKMAAPISHVSTHNAYHTGQIL